MSEAKAVTEKDEAEILRRSIQEYRGRVSELERQLRQVRGTLVAVNRENEHNRLRLQMLRRSWSWKITSPFRRTRRAIGHFLRRVQR